MQYEVIKVMKHKRDLKGWRWNWGDRIVLDYEKMTGVYFTQKTHVYTQHDISLYVLYIHIIFIEDKYLCLFYLEGCCA